MTPCPNVCGVRLSLSGQVERGASLKQVLQTMEACPDLAHLGLCGLRKWNSRGLKGQVQLSLFDTFTSLREKLMNYKP